MKDKQTHEMTLNVFSVITLNTQTKLEKHLSQSQVFECTRQLVSPSYGYGKMRVVCTGSLINEENVSVNSL